MDTTTTIAVSPAEIEELVAGFQDHSLPGERWTHQAHLIVGTYFAYHFPLEQAIYYLRSGIITYNVATGGLNDDHAGYHETLTQLYVRAIAAERAASSELPFGATLARLLAPPLGDSRWPLAFWSKGRLFSVAARRGWVEPDLAPLPDALSRVDLG